MEYIRVIKEWFVFVREIREYFLEELKIDLRNEWMISINEEGRKSVRR